MGSELLEADNLIVLVLAFILAVA